MAVKELLRPPATEQAHHATELVRAWIVDKDLHCSLNVGSLGENENIVWGILLSDVARHVANAIERDKGVPANETLTQIASSFDFEIRTPTAEVKGNFI
jgi:Domain of unknown function (DUF5076)